MKKSAYVVGLLATALGLAGCGTMSTSQLFGNDSGTERTQAYQDLSMPPDLQLPPPQAAPAQGVQTASATPGTVDPVTGANQPKGDIYEQYGVSKVHSDGTPKTDAELRKDLQVAILARKRQQNPNYGTFWNWGALFSGD
jgi:hypothetical protein